jgi:hypothetical protein
MRSGPPPSQGLYDPRYEHDSCGVNFIVHMKGERSNDIVQTGIGALCNLQHRGAILAQRSSPPRTPPSTAARSSHWAGARARRDATRRPPD